MKASIIDQLRLVDYTKYLKATSKSKAKQADVDKLADEVNASWWAKNKKNLQIRDSLNHAHKSNSLRCR